MKLQDKLSEAKMNYVDAEHFDGTINDRIDVRLSECKLRFCEATTTSHFAAA